MALHPARFAAPDAQAQHRPFTACPSRLMVAKYVTEFTVQSTKGAQRRLRAEQHAQRLARKALRDAARKASQSEDAARSPTNIIGLDCATEPTKVGLVLARFSGELLVIQEAR